MERVLECIVCKKAELIPNNLGCGHIICNKCIQRQKLVHCISCFTPIKVKFTIEVPLSETPITVAMLSETGERVDATILLHGQKYNTFLAKRRVHGERFVETAQTRLEYEEFLNWQQEVKNKN